MKTLARRRFLLSLLCSLLLFTPVFPGPAALASTPAAPGQDAGVVPGCEADPGPLASVEAAVALAVDGQAGKEPGVLWLIHSICRRGDWAFVYVKGYQAATGAPLPTPSHVALARRLDDGWQAVLPEKADSYNVWLALAPATLLPESMKMVLRQPSPAAVKAQLIFSGYGLPYPSGQSAFVIKHWYPAIDFSIGAAGPPAIIRNSKAGIVMFVKGSSSRLCGDPPPDYSCWQWGNVVVLQTGPDEYAWYVHMVAGTVPNWIQPGAYVPAGSDLGMEGETGWASAPHLHFMVSSTYSCCIGEGDSLFPNWPSYTTYRVDFSEYAWSQLPYTALSQNGEPAAGAPAPTAPPPSPTAPPVEVAASQPTPAAPPPESPPPAPPATGGLCPSPYTVQPGEWLLRIASKCGVTVAGIVSVNPGLSPDYIRAGQLINLPASAASAAGPAAPPPEPQPAPTEAAAAPPPEPASAAACSGVHIVAAGENLFRLAYNCGLTTHQLAAHNGIPYPYTIYVGQVLRYP